MVWCSRKLERSRGRAGALARAFAWVIAAAPLGACDTISSLWASRDADPAFDQPADKLYNEGLYLLNAKRDPKAAAKRFE